MQQDMQWKSIYTLGAVVSLLVIAGTIADLVIGMTLSGDFSLLPDTASGRFAQFQTSWLLGLYHLDILNLIISVLMLPVYLALTAAHRYTDKAFAILAILMFTVGLAVFISSNAALPMLELSRRYADTPLFGEKSTITAAGEALLARGAHGSLGAFPGFALLSMAAIFMSIGMIKGKVFNRLTAFTGLAGGLLLLVYLILITFIPAIEIFAIYLAAPGGIMSLLWMILYTVRLFKLRNTGFSGD
ncbi:MAG: hypothetical protein ACYCYI_13405 [Saccharofermentanales bacterium]